MDDFKQQTIKRYQELANRSREQGIYTYTEFHSPHGASYAFEAAPKEEVKLWGGMEYAERTVIRFGNPGEILYEEEFPIRVLHFVPKAEKFAEELTHRDYLGAIMNLGIERNQIGDIVVTGKEAYIFVLEKVAEFICDSIDRIKHTNVKTEVVGVLPKDVRVEIRYEEYSVSSLRMDGVLSKVLNLSRENAKNLILSEKVIADGKVILKPEYEPKENETIIVRGFGRFIFEGKQRENKKWKTVILVGKM